MMRVKMMSECMYKKDSLLIPDDDTLPPSSSSYFNLRRYTHSPERLCFGPPPCWLLCLYMYIQSLCVGIYTCCYRVEKSKVKETGHMQSTRPPVCIYLISLLTSLVEITQQSLFKGCTTTNTFCFTACVQGTRGGRVRIKTECVAEKKWCHKEESSSFFFLEKC